MTHIIRVDDSGDAREIYEEIENRLPGRLHGSDVTVMVCRHADDFKMGKITAIITVSETNNIYHDT